MRARSILAGLVGVLVLPLMVGAALAESTTLVVDNRTSSYVTVNVDGVYGCNTAAGTTCTIPVTVGIHDLWAQRSDSGAVIETRAEVGADGATWTLTDQ